MNVASSKDCDKVGIAVDGGGAAVIDVAVVGEGGWEWIIIAKEISKRLGGGGCLERRRRRRRISTS